MLLSANPLTLFMLAIAGVLLLLDDYYIYLEGGDAAFGEFWDNLGETKERLDEMFAGFDVGEVLGNRLSLAAGAAGNKAATAHPNPPAALREHVDREYQRPR